MRLIRVSLLIAAVPALALATTVFYSDPFGAAATSCASASCDVIGKQALFDIESLSITADRASQTALLTVRMNFGHRRTLSPFNDRSVRVEAADIFFMLNGVIQYGIALTDHGDGSVVAGNLYEVANPTGVMSAFDVLHLGAGYVYRPEFPVWLRDDGNGSIVHQGSGKVTTAVTGDGVTSGRLTVSISFTPTSQFTDLILRGALTAEFASATSAKDVLIAPLLPPSPAGSPEPATIGLTAIGLLALCYKAQAAAPTIRRVLRS